MSNNNESEPMLRSNIELMDVPKKTTSAIVQPETSMTAVAAATGGGGGGNDEVYVDGEANETSWNDEGYDDYLDCVTENSPYQKLSPQRRLFLFTLIVIVVISVILFGWEDVTVQEDLELDETFQVKNNNTTSSDHNNHKTKYTGTIKESPVASSSSSSSSSCVVANKMNYDKMAAASTTCSDLCTIRQTNRIERYGGKDLLNPNDVLQLARNGREEMIRNLRKDYGKYFDGIFIKNTPDTGDDDDDPVFHGMHGYIVPNGKSRDRLKLKLKLKVLKMMQAVRDFDSNGGISDDDDDGDCIPDFYERYVFANGGHSNAAGHGNKFNETYTAFFTNDVKKVFEVIGIQVQGRNYAMGGMGPFPHISTCISGVFGIDVDLLSWNFGMTEALHDAYPYYIYRAATSPGRPAVVTIDGSNKDKEGIILEETGIPHFRVNNFVESWEAFPDSKPDNIDLSKEELDNLPEFVRYAKCNERKESNGDICTNNKWSCTQSMIKAGRQCDCPNVKKRGSWHMGFKMHALYGHWLALPLVEIMIEGIKEISESSKDTVTLLKEIQEKENQDYDDFLSKPVPSSKVWFGKEGDSSFEDMWYKRPNLCRTSLMPSRSRLLGLATNSEKTGDIAMPGQGTYDYGLLVSRNKNGPDADMSYHFPSDPDPTPGLFTLVGMFETTTEDNCKSIVMPDSKDFFYGVFDKDGKVRLTIPNEKEKSAYGYSPEKYKGVLGLSTHVYRENQKGADHPFDIVIADFQKNISVKVNGKPANAIVDSDKKRMIILENAETGSIYWEPSKDLNYVIEFQAHGDTYGSPTTNLHFRLDTIILY